MSFLEEGLALCSATGERFHEAELHRLRGSSLLLQAPRRQAEAETCFRRALDVARHQAAKAVELRALVSLSRLYSAEGRGAEARQRLAECHSWFSEGLATLDYEEAGAVLALLI
jgi:adenylate cyclase